jgi:plastocyanin|tara:strand:+ start:218 stop:367 length:150 start_codon:yes stop_codon:yes gene_type:complete
MGTKVDWVHIDSDMHNELKEKLSKAKSEEEKEKLHKEYHSKIFSTNGNV